MSERKRVAVEVARTHANHVEEIIDEWFGDNMHLLPEAHRPVDANGMVHFKDVMVRAIGHEAYEPGEFAIVYVRDETDAELRQRLNGSA